MSRMETPVLLLTGYLGSGKTTLVNHILSNKKGIIKLSSFLICLELRRAD